MSRLTNRLVSLLPSGETTLLHPMLLAAAVGFSVATAFVVDAVFGNAFVTGVATLAAISLVPPLRRWWAPRDPGRDYQHLPGSIDVPGSHDDLVTKLGAMMAYAASFIALVLVFEAFGLLPDLGQVEGGRTSEEMSPIVGLLIACFPIWSEAEARIAAYRIHGRDSQARELSRRVEAAAESPEALIPLETIEVPMKKARAWGAATLGIATALALIIVGTNWVSDDGWDLGTVALLAGAMIALAVSLRHAWLYGVAPYLLRADSTGFDPMGAGLIPWTHVRRIELTRDERLHYLAFDISSRSREDEEADDQRVVREIEAAERAGDDEAATARLDAFLETIANDKPTGRWCNRRHRAALHGATSMLRVPLGLSKWPAPKVAAAISVLSGRKIERIGRGEVTMEEIRELIAEVEAEPSREPEDRNRA